MDMFKEADVDGSGCLDVDEIKRLLNTKSLAARGRPVFSEEFVENCILRADKKGDGRINLDEFVRLMVIHLPDARIAADNEFQTDIVGCKLSWMRERAERIATTVLEAVLDRQAIRRLAACALVTIAAGTLEASLLVDPSHPFAVAFALNYAFEQLVPSVVWMTQDAALVAASMGDSAKEVLLDLDSSCRGDAVRLLAAGQCQAVRSIAAGFGLLGQVLYIMQVTARAKADFEQRVRAGQEAPLTSGAEERIIRLCGKSSYTTYATKAGRGRYHVLPVMSPQDLPSVARIMSENFRYPLFLDVPTRQWGQPPTWESALGTSFPASWLLKGNNGQPILCLEVDGTNAEEILLYGQEREVGIEEASCALRAIATVVLRSLSSSGFDAQSVRLLRVYFGDSHETAHTGAGHAYTCRERVSKRHEADVLIDAHAPVLHRLRLWGLDLAAEGESRPTFVFETSCSERFQNLAHLMHDTADIVDQVEALRLQKAGGPPLPRLIHYPTTAETVNAAHGLVNSTEGADPSQTLVLCTRLWGAAEVRQLGLGFQVLCAAELMDDLLREVRQWARLGFSRAEIQGELDRRYSGTLNLITSALHAKASCSKK